tara:strand:+ start:221 stop:733 length:513 start_codon:yes stop_codon:yes gene_type:complete
MSQPNNINFMSPVGAKFVIKRLPSVNFFVQTVTVPSVQMGEIQMPSPFSVIPLPGDKLQFSDLSIGFRVDEDMNNYREMYSWLRSMTRVSEFADSTAWKNERTPMHQDGVYSDATLTLLNSAMNPNVEIRFADLFPTSISELNFATTDLDINFIECIATFKYTKFEVVKL